MKTLSFIVLLGLVAYASASFDSVCEFTKGFGAGVDGPSCAEGFGDNCDALENIFEAIGKLFQGKWFEFAMIAIQTWDYIKSYFEIMKDCNIFKLFIDYFKNFIAIIKTYPKRIESMYSNIKCAFSKIGEGDYYEVGVCIGDLVTDLFERNYK